MIFDSLVRRFLLVHFKADRATSGNFETSPCRYRRCLEMKIGATCFNNCTIYGVFLFVVLFSTNSLSANDFYGWHHGASGYSDAIQEAKYEEQPLIIYFHIEKCKWCKEMNDNYLASYEADEFLSDIPKVEINPDKGADENALTRQYNITGYPSFLYLFLL